MHCFLCLPNLNIVKTFLFTDGATHLCNCQANDNVWRYDEGTIGDKSLLPVTRLYFSDTNGRNEKGNFTLGPLVCSRILPGGDDTFLTVIWRFNNAV